MRGSINGDTPKWMVYSGKSKKKIRKPPYGDIMGFTIWL